jgi:hypothetical protein
LWSSPPVTMNRETGPQLERSIMRKLITIIALLALIDTSVAIAQPLPAPVGHRQPRADQVPDEKNLMGNPNDPIDRENAALDRMVKSICRGC